MKFICLLILFFATTIVNGQVFDEPIDSTTHYNLRLYAQNAQVPAEILNEDKQTIDSVLYSLIAMADTLQFVMIYDPAISDTFLVFKISNYAHGKDTFSGTSQTDTIAVSGIDSSDTILLSAFGTSVNANDILSAEIIEPTTLVIHRPASGTSGLQYTWRWIRRY